MWCRGAWKGHVEVTPFKSVTASYEEELHIRSVRAQRRVCVDWAVLSTYGQDLVAAGFAHILILCRRQYRLEVCKNQTKTYHLVQSVAYMDQDVSIRRAASRFPGVLTKYPIIRKTRAVVGRRGVVPSAVAAR